MTITAKLFRIGEHQAVQLPRSFELDGDWVSIRRVRNGILLESLRFDSGSWFAELDQLRSEPFMKEGRNQPKIRTRKQK